MFWKAQVLGPPIFSAKQNNMQALRTVANRMMAHKDQEKPATGNRISGC